jgi:hypothetical protein
MNSNQTLSKAKCTLFLKIPNPQQQTIQFHCKNLQTPSSIDVTLNPVNIELNPRMPIRKSIRTWHALQFEDANINNDPLRLILNSRLKRRQLIDRLK